MLLNWVVFIKHKTIPIVPYKNTKNQNILQTAYEMLKNINTNFNFLNFMLIKINIKIPDKYILLFERTLCVLPSGLRPHFASRRGGPARMRGSGGQKGGLSS